ncbi:hypothetical protein A462_24789 [Pseudomonas sp. Ag1]|jgi:hypothetical protein|nr:hypothetical protein A462_24789 [Pseudomonas sp. Ag1]
MNGVGNLFLRTKPPVMLHKNILLNSINNCDYRNPIISIMGNDITRDFITNFSYLVLSSFSDQKSSFRKLTCNRLNIRKSNKTITNLIFNKLTTIVLEGRNYSCPFGTWERLGYKRSLLVFDEHVPQHQEWLDSFHKKIPEISI